MQFSTCSAMALATFKELTFKAKMLRFTMASDHNHVACKSERECQLLVLEDKTKSEESEEMSRWNQRSTRIGYSCDNN
jgi:hypothetical protein